MILMLAAELEAGEVKSSDIGWFRKTFCELSWDEVKISVESPRDICRRVKGQVEYKVDSEDNMKTGIKTWEDKTGDCEDFANCVVELCQANGFEAWVEIYYEANNSSAHAVAMGKYNGRLWISSNGDFQFVKDTDDARRKIARTLGWSSRQVCHDSYLEFVKSMDLAIAAEKSDSIP